MAKFYDEKVKKVLKEIERILTEDAARSHGVKIVLDMQMNEVTYISYEIKEMMVRNI